MIWTPYKIHEQIHISEMYSFFKFDYDKSYYFAGEMHAFWECVYVASGEICAIADDRMYNLSQGSLIFHKPLETHKFHITSDETATIIIFSFSAEGVDSVQVIGGTNVQFAHDPVSDRIIVIEINPRTSRSSALASKATGFPIALVSAMLATGLTLKDIHIIHIALLDLSTAMWIFSYFSL